jgi:hypothetical protein
MLMVLKRKSYPNAILFTKNPTWSGRDLTGVSRGTEQRQTIQAMTQT